MAAPNGTPLIQVRHLVKHFPLTKGILIQRQVGAVQAVDDVSFDVLEGETLGLVGESGCGKSTTARLVMSLMAPTGGSILYQGSETVGLKGAAQKALRREMQMVFQDPYSSLNPRKTIGSIISEPFTIHGLHKEKGGRKKAVQELMDLVGLNPEHYNRYPHQFSGGQRQRIGVARALALKPKLIVADEPVSALDVSIQAQILNLLRELQRDLGLTLIFIAHDLSVVRHMCDRIAVMYLGKIVEQATAQQLYAHPRMPYTGALMSAVPIPDPILAAAKRRQLLRGDVPVSDQPACRLPLPHPLPQGADGLWRRSPAAGGEGWRQPRRLPLPPHRRRGRRTRADRFPRVAGPPGDARRDRVACPNRGGDHPSLRPRSPDPGAGRRTA